MISMKNKFKCLKTAAAAALLTLSMAISAFAATGKLSFSDPSVTAGDEVNVTMKIAAEEGATLTDATVTLSYDPAMLEFVAGTDADGGAGTVRVHGASNGAGTGQLEYNLRFKTLSAGQSVISVNTQEVYDGDSQPVQLEHLGTSTVTASAGEEVSTNADLSTLEVAPGSLSPAFSADATSYEVTVGASVNQLSINALPADSGASVIVSGNDALVMGDNTVTITVKAPDGTTTKEYTITVHKTEDGAENPTEGTESSEGETESQPTETQNSGVQLSSKGKTITIMNPGSDVQIPEGFKAGTIIIDGQKVQGWVWGADSEQPKYCVVYGMNDQGELNFYRYDMTEKTIQRYFEDPLAANSVSNQQYAELSDSYDKLVQQSEMSFLIICILALVGLVLLATVIYLFAKLRNLQRPDPKPRRGGDGGGSEGSSYNEEADLLKHDFEPSAEEHVQAPIDETQVLKRPQPRRRGKNALASQDTAPIARVPETEEKKDPEDDEFDTFNI